MEFGSCNQARREYCRVRTGDPSRSLSAVGRRQVSGGGPGQWRPLVAGGVRTDTGRRGVCHPCPASDRGGKKAGTETRTMNRINPDKMSRAELDRLGAAAERVCYRNTRPMTPDARRALARAGRKGGRPRIGAGAKRINVTVENTLLRKADAYAQTWPDPRRGCCGRIEKDRRRVGQHPPSAVHEAGFGISIRSSVMYGDGSACRFPTCVVTWTRTVFLARVPAGGEPPLCHAGGDAGVAIEPSAHRSAAAADATAIVGSGHRLALATVLRAAADESQRTLLRRAQAGHDEVSRLRLEPASWSTGAATRWL